MRNALHIKPVHCEPPKSGYRERDRAATEGKPTHTSHLQICLCGGVLGVFIVMIEGATLIFVTAVAIYCDVATKGLFIFYAARTVSHCILVVVAELRQRAG